MCIGKIMIDTNNCKNKQNTDLFDIPHDWLSPLVKSC